ncbi:MAG TPA: DUF6222 family protein [Actinophytocola sp.]|uniref:DUF6222 family protein n=1 Tax=Actinophytocola sp. TaxID=1872138 RepID=UPI002F95956F
MPRLNEPDRERETPAETVEDLQPTRIHSNLARGIVWADILADIAADEAARRLPDAA